MTISESTTEPFKTSGSMHVGFYTAQLGVELAVDSTSLTISSWQHLFRIDRENLLAIDNTSFLRIFKRGVRFRHCQPNLPEKVMFFPSMDLDLFRQQLNEAGW